TFHIYLTLGNAADTVTGSVEVTLLSKLKTDISLAPEKDGCSEITRYINNITIGEPDSIIIDWGDGGAKEVLYDNLKRIPHKYENTSTGIKRYEIVLKAENSCEHASDTVKIAIHPKSAIPIIELSNEKSEYLKTCYDTPIGFLNSSVGFGGSAYRATWYFGDDQTAIVTDIKDTLIEHSFSEPGEYIIRLKVEDRCNTDTTSIPLTVKGSRDLSISVPEELYCEQQNIAMSAVTETAFTNFKWTFGDGQTDKSGKRNVTHKYAYNATPWYLGLSAVFEGCETEATLVPISIKRSPQARISAKNFSNTGNCSVLTVDFDGYNDNADVYNPNIFWDFGNGETATSWLDQSATYSIDPNEGTRKDSTFYVTMVVTSQEGCSDTAEIKKITVNYSPAPEFTIDQHLFCTTDGKLTVDITNITRFKELHSYEWYKNDNDRPFSISPNPGSIDFEGIGELSIKLVATHKENFCKAENMVTFISSESVKAAFDFSTGNVCESAPVTVLPSVTPGVTFKWKMGDGSAAFETTDQFDYTYPEVGNYVIEVIATNGDMCADTLAKEIVVYPIPTAGFTWEKDFSIVEGYPENINLPAIENGGVRFTNESYIWNDQWGDELSYTWNFGDNTNVSHEKDPRHEYKKSGSFDATLLIASAYGCTDSMTTNITLDHIKGLYVPTAFAPSMSDQGVALFLPKGVSLSSYSLEIYDQWGKFLWSTTLLTEDGQPVEGWDGKFEGTEMPKGVYIWRINAVFANGEVWSKNGKISGTFTLIR
ncbi:PKD domain-containing protein, partial [Porphyromonadaceae bacterium OttesenSCG-928-L07]|nr:PKD domain-containing protein [Porphyromonadaceae bacterium OttesenSCG-928-L07]